MGHAVRYMAREEEERTKKYSDRTLFKRILNIFGYYKTESISVVAIVLLASIFSSLIPIVMQRTIDYFIYFGSAPETRWAYTSR